MTVKFEEIKTGEIFTIGETISYPKMKTDTGYIDIRDGIRKDGNCRFPVRLMTKKEVGIAFYGATIAEVKEAVKKRLNIKD